MAETGGLANVLAELSVINGLMTWKLLLMRSAALHICFSACVCVSVCVVCCVFCVVCCHSSERGSFFVSSRFFINFTPLFVVLLVVVVVYSGHNMIIFLWPTFNLFAHVSATCNGSVREIERVRGSGGETARVFLLPQYRHLSAHAFIFVRKNCQPVA